MSEPTNAEIKTLIEQMIVSGERRETSRIEWQTKQDIRYGRLETEVLRVSQKIDQHDEILRKEVPVIAERAREAMQSYDSLQGYVHGEIKDHIAEQIEAANKPVLEALRQQDRDADRRAAVEAESRRQESLAVKTLKDRREYWIKVGGFIVAVLAVAIPTAGSMYGSYLANEKAHEETMAKQADTSAKVDRLQRTLDTKPVVRWEDEPVTTAAAPPPASPSKK